MGTWAPQHTSSSARAQRLSLDISLAPTSNFLGTRGLDSSLEAHEGRIKFSWVTPIPQVEAGARLCFQSSFWVRWEAEGAWVRPSLKPTGALKWSKMWIWRFCFIICSSYTMNGGFWGADKLQADGHHLPLALTLHVTALIEGIYDTFPARVQALLASSSPDALLSSSPSLHSARLCWEDQEQISPETPGTAPSNHGWRLQEK